MEEKRKACRTDDSGDLMVEERMVLKQT